MLDFNGTAAQLGSPPSGLISKKFSAAFSYYLLLLIKLKFLEFILNCHCV